MIRKKPFTTAASKFGLDKEKAAWKSVPLRESEKEDHKYIEGLEKLGNDILSKNKDRSKEVTVIHQIDKKNEFNQFGRPDIWKSTLHISQSLRTKQMDDILKSDPVYDHFSKNDYLDCYKQNLVQTGNVDHIVPFKHSQNKQGLKMNYLRQNPSPKLYPMSACQELAKEYFQKTSQQQQDDELGFNYPVPKRDASMNSLTKAYDQAAKLPKVTANISRHAIAEEGPETMPSEKTNSMYRGSRGSFTSSIRGRFGKKGKEVSEKEKVDKLVKLYFK